MNIISKIYFYSMWFVGTPVMIIFIIIYAFIGYAPMSVWYGDEDIYPMWSSVIGKLLVFISFSNKNPRHDDDLCVRCPCRSVLCIWSGYQGQGSICTTSGLETGWRLNLIWNKSLFTFLLKTTMVTLNTRFWEKFTACLDHVCWTTTLTTILIV